jgi:hypothetical protein
MIGSFAIARVRACPFYFLSRKEWSKPIMFSKLRFIWKFSILAALIPLTAAIMSILGGMDVISLKAQYDNLYGFMLIPIENIQEASIHLKNIMAGMAALNTSSLTDAQRNAVGETIRKEDHEMSAIISRHDHEWVNTLSREFTEGAQDQTKAVSKVADITGQIAVAIQGQGISTNAQAGARKAAHKP